MVGAGPGDPELLTVKAKKIIDSTDVIIYADSLVSPETFSESRAKEIVKTSTLNIEQINMLVKK
ncbi:SAM-dependent methyltransferase, partial [Ferroplasma acidiphilum]|uniref:SAM-dependent methyltransferase n=1 Tax=Ferroplasma acidiphilum TaxID=74969 RepID=UPI003AFFBAC5